MILAITYGNEKFEKAKKYNKYTAFKYGKVDNFIEFSDKDIDEEFFNSNKEILEQKRGNGYWLWKPYFIRKALNVVNYGDYLIYSDSGCAYINNVKYLIECMEKNKVDIMPFSLGKFIEEQYTKMDIFYELECNIKKMQETPQYMATIVLIKKTENTIKFIDNWIKYGTSKKQLITDKASINNNSASFIDNRHDQSIFSVLCKKNEFISFKDPSQFGKYRLSYFSKDELDRSDYPPIFIIHRYNKASSLISIYFIFVIRWLKRIKSKKRLISFSEQFK